MNTRLILAVGIAMGLAAQGCATLLAPGPDLVPVRSDPAGASVQLDGKAVGITPCVVAVPRKSEGVFRFELSGYEPVTVDRNKVLNGWFLADFFLPYLWLPAMTVDLIAGNVGKYSRKPLEVKLKKLERPEPLRGAPISGTGLRPGICKEFP